MNNLINFFKILSDDTRLRILVLLYHKKLCVCQMCGIMEESQPKVSKHLGKLRDMGFVKDERQEQFVFYDLNLQDEALKEILKRIVDNKDNYPILEADIEKIKGVEKYLETCKG
ncbi:metalloregulator ArsR/SmtB family transcription factor [Proteiniborus sp. MB09-C3]|uniref:ArsR/SmtB family transcription factor n=1 Tax=Proteiniborus sp. MB09-C3 TaxID=3050072 RepID=UPI0025553AC0|nr:metalloregulator ArsR/SmtB family transcription factor [Proteiniborus sp. MB09-C3]WIV12681.1 metalloregulator ArsR/SmtB family transcription factor [Proteiniborus sp. MB09-C3]